jgi:tRNA (uracil-5-)-methyltransferase TRM9
MNAATQERLLALNREFYSQVATEFDQTRGGLAVGWQRLQPLLPLVPPDQPCRVLDAGCGNGRFARALAQWGDSFHYLGIDADTELLRLAARHTADLPQVTAQFQQVDLTAAGWAQTLPTSPRRFDLVVCFAVLHHLPGYQLRLRVVKDLAVCLATDGVLLLSNWQFLTSDRFLQKRIPWQQVGLTEADVESGDALLPWQQGGYAVRYVHQIDQTEMTQLAQDANLTIVEQFYADGKEGNLNLYTVLKPRI